VSNYIIHILYIFIIHIKVERNIDLQRDEMEN